MTSRTWWRNPVVGLAAVGPVFIGVMSTLLGAFMILGGDFTPAALFLLAAGLSFGLLSIAVFGPTA